MAFKHFSPSSYAVLACLPACACQQLGSRLVLLTKKNAKKKPHTCNGFRNWRLAVIWMMDLAETSSRADHKGKNERMEIMNRLLRDLGQSEGREDVSSDQIVDRQVVVVGPS